MLSDLKQQFVKVFKKLKCKNVQFELTKEQKMLKKVYYQTNYELDIVHILQTLKKLRAGLYTAIKDDDRKIKECMDVYNDMVSVDKSRVFDDEFLTFLSAEQDVESLN